jgi:SAM-dependent methyltransferase
LFPTPYTGIDIEDGASVDLVADVMTHDFDEKFNTIVCTETLEHLPAPWEAVERMAGWLNPGGHLIVTTPFMHPLHDFPGDYFRFTGEGLRVLFDRAGLTTILATQDEQATYETARLSEGDPTDLIYVGTGVMRTAYGVAQCSSRGGLCES